MCIRDRFNVYLILVSSSVSSLMMTSSDIQLMKATLLTMQRETDNLRKIIARLLQSVHLWKDCKESPLTAKLFSHNWNGENPLHNTPHRRVSSPCKSCTRVIRQRWSVIVKSLKRKMGMDKWNRTDDAAEDEIGCV